MEASSEIFGADVLNTHLEFVAWQYEGNTTNLEQVEFMS